MGRVLASSYQLRVLLFTNVVLSGLTACFRESDPNDTWQTKHSLISSGDTAGNWACLNDPVPGAPAMDSGPAKTVTYKLPIVDWVSGAPVNGLSILQCAAVDGNCSSPLQPGPLKVQDNRATRAVAVRLEKGFSGFLKLGSTDGIGPLPDGTPDLFNAYVPAAYYFGNTVFADRVIASDIKMLRAPILNQIAANIGVALDPIKALLVLEGFDCDENPAPGVRFEIDSSGAPFTLIGGLPKLPTQPETFVPTDAAGQAGFANVDPGYVFVDAFVANENDRISRAPVAATALPGQITVVEVHARPFGIVPTSASAEK